MVRWKCGSGPDGEALISQRYRPKSPDVSTAVARWCTATPSPMVRSGAWRASRKRALTSPRSSRYRVGGYVTVGLLSGRGERPTAGRPREHPWSQRGGCDRDHLAEFRAATSGGLLPRAEGSWHVAP